MGNPAIELDWRLRERRRARRKQAWQTSGGVVLDPDTGHVLLVKNRRERREGYSGWTWPKGLIDPGEGPVFAALREIAEEAGVHAEPLGRIAVLETKRALRHYFLLSKIRGGLELHEETLRVRWAPVRDAKRFLERKRDRVVLKAAKRMIRQIEQGRLPPLWIVG